MPTPKRRPIKLTQDTYSKTYKFYTKEDGRTVLDLGVAGSVTYKSDSEMVAALNRNGLTVELL